MKVQVNATFFEGATFEKGVFTAFLQHLFKKRCVKDFITLDFSFLLTLAIQNRWETQGTRIYDLNRLSESSAFKLAIETENVKQAKVKKVTIFQ